MTEEANKQTNEERIAQLETALGAQVMFTKQLVHFLGVIVQKAENKVHFGIYMPEKGERHRILSQVFADIDKLKNKSPIIIPGR